MLYEDGEMKLGAYEHENGYGNDDDGDYDGDGDSDDDDTLAVMTVTMMMVTLFHTGCPCTQRFIFFLGSRHSLNVWADSAARGTHSTFGLIQPLHMTVTVASISCRLASQSPCPAFFFNSATRYR